MVILIFAGNRQGILFVWKYWHKIEKMTDQELIALMRLQKIPQLGPVRSRKLIGLAGSALEVFQNRVYRNFCKHKPELLKEFEKVSYAKAAAAELAKSRSLGLQCYAYFDPEYPNLLRNCNDAPLTLFSKGNTSWNNRRILAVVGTREMTPYGQRVCDNFISGIAAAEPVIVSGLAFGVDIYAQRCALKHGLTTIGCLAHGLDSIYPKAHAQWAKSIEKNGGFVSEFWTNTAPEAFNFVRRNRIIAGLAAATVVIESGSKGGSLITANFAFDYNREVFAVPGRTDDPQSRGCNDLIRDQKAQLLSTPEHFLEAMQWEITPKPVQESNFIAPGHWTEAEKRLAATLHGADTLSMDYLIRYLNLTVQELSTALFNLEMQGFIQPLPGKNFAWRGKGN
ncbi:MAG: hypothetical protein RLZZ241_1702 [Bacteroidota bacterium]|jgi:DNA processing protein